MTKFDTLRRFLPCMSPPPPPATGAATKTATVSTKKRLSASLRDDIVEKPNPKAQENPQEPSKCSSSSTSSSSAAADTIIPAVPQRSSKTMVVGTIFGKRKGHVWFCVQHNRLSTKPLLLLELSIQTHQLVHEMSSGLVRIALECPNRSELSRCALRSVPVWTMFCNGRKFGSAVKRHANEQNRLMLKKMQATTVGAGAIPGSGSGSGSDTEEVMYMRANYEHIVGSSDSESFHLVNPDAASGQELSIFLLRH